MKTTQIIILSLAIVSTIACQKQSDDSVSRTAKRGIALMELNDDSLVDVNCLVAAAKANLAPQVACPTIQKSQIRGLSDAKAIADVRGTCKNKCGGDNYYYYSNNGWNDFYSNPYYSTYYYSYNPQTLPNNWYSGLGISTNYFNLYLYRSNSYGSGYGSGYGNSSPNYYNYGGSYYNYNPSSSCNSTWYGGDFTRYGSCWSGWFWR